MILRSAVIGLAIAITVVLGGCTSDETDAGGSDATTDTRAGDDQDVVVADEFCTLMTDLNQEPPDLESADWLARYARAGEIAPEQFREALAAQLALMEAQADLPTGPDANDLTGDLGYMELVAATQTASFRAAAEEMATYLIDECGIEFEERDEGTPATFTSIAPAVEPDE